MPIGREILGDGWRVVEIPVVGKLEVRRATMRDIANAGPNPYWWLSCVRCLDGTNLLPDGVAAADIDATIGNAIIQEIMADRPTAARNGGSSG